MPGLEGAAEVCEAYQAEALQAWQAQQEHLHALLKKHIGRERWVYINRPRMAKCRELAESLKKEVPVSCLNWSKAITRFTDQASQELALPEGDTLYKIPSRLKNGIMAVQSNEGHKVESIAVSPL